MSENLPVEPEAPQPSPPPAGTSRPRLKWYVLIALVAGLSIVGAAWHELPPAEKARIIRKVERVVGRDARKLEKDAKTDLSDLEKDAKTDLSDLDKDGRTDLTDLEKDAKSDAWKLEVDAKEEADKLSGDAELTTANGGEALLSDARLTLHELADRSPPAVPVETPGQINSALSTVQTKLQLNSFPDRPAPLLESKDNPFFGRGYITKGFHSFTGAWWQPQYFIYGQFRSGVQTLHSGIEPRTSEWVNRLDIYADLNVTPTERILVGLRPLDLQDNAFSGYSFSQPGALNAVNARITTLFYEGNLLSLVPSLDDGRDNWLDLDMTVGRQYVTYQNGMLLNDYVDMVGLTRASTFELGSSATTLSFVQIFNNVHRTDSFVADAAKVFGGIMRSDYHTSTLEGDFFFSADNSGEGGDGVYAALSAVQRIGKFNTSFRVLGSAALENDRLNAAAVGNGALMTAQISTKPADTDNVLYLDAFWGPGRFTSVSRTFDVGGPLSTVGLLYAETQLGHFGAALSSYPDNTYGGAVGYQIFLDDLATRQVTFELGGEAGSQTANYAAGAGAFQYQQSFAQHFVWTVGAVGGVQNGGTPIWGARSEISVNF